NIADILVDPEGSLERRSHWEKTGHALLVGVILHVLYAEREKTLARVAAFLSDPSRTFERSLSIMMSTNHLGTKETPKVHPVVAQAARELLNKSDNERSGVLSTAMSFLGLYRDPTIAHVTSACDWRIEDLVAAKNPASLYLVVPPSDISRTKPLIRLILNQIGRRLTEELESAPTRKRYKLLMMLDEFPALGRLDFFESALAFMAGYGVRAYLIAQSLNQIEKAYGPNNSILDNCHVRVAFAANDERTAKRISDALGTATELRAQRNYAGHRLAPWLAHVMVSRQETARPLLTPGEVMQLPSDEAIALISGAPPIRAKKLQYYCDRNFSARRLPAVALAQSHGRYPDAPPAKADDWSGMTAAPDRRLDQPWFDLVRGDDPESEGGLAQTPELDPIKPAPIHATEREERPEDETDDLAAARRLKDLTRETARRTVSLDRSLPSLLPGI
ncbi:MAG: IncP-type conjugal transfer protein TraG, partial [Parvularculaceae bacterium]|nr:IncP-type conjugal transfer protein TraG [Parvularculaceae bacterium]